MEAGTRSQNTATVESPRSAPPAAMLRRKGKAVRLVEFPDAFHAFYGFPELPDAGRVVEEIKAFIESNSSIHCDPAA
ncbi:unnamed protein product [Triticum turgidum subsp. durum]|uniref:Alpha/beta hydrolase fold-3 domain-containing protein n=1 Tax=Triticum turgidum subsp. durum TaxID=4567 RepID=A0A9R0ZWC4_TRITD|nr:unnamed protein product [Triticum turgidum subsp. durum]